MKIIGVNGYKRSGKGETARLASEILTDGGYACESVGFADKLKIIAARSLGYLDLTDQQCIDLMDEAKESWVIDIKRNVRDEGLAFTPYSPGRLNNGYTTTVPVTHLTGRQYLQHLGNQARVVFGESFWIDQVLPNPATMQGADAPSWMDYAEAELDNRYEGAEYLFITDLRYPNEAERIKDLGGVIWEVVRPGTGSDGHASEEPLPEKLIDWIIYNSLDLTALSGQVAGAILETL